MKDMENNKNAKFLVVFKYEYEIHTGIGNLVVEMKNSTPTSHEIRAAEKAIAEQMDAESVVIVNMMLLGE